MRKYFLLFVVLALFLSGCAHYRVASLTFSFDDGAIPPQYYSEGKMEFLPDYESRSLNVNYNLRFPYRTEETPEADFTTQAVIGGIYFDRFEEIVKKLAKDDFAATEDGCAGGQNLLITWVSEKAEVMEKDFYLCGGLTEDLSVLELYYRDVLALLEENVF